jgi:hypothetical protein
VGYAHYPQSCYSLEIFAIDMTDPERIAIDLARTGSIIADLVYETATRTHRAGGTRQRQLGARSRQFPSPGRARQRRMCPRTDVPGDVDLVTSETATENVPR